MKILLVHGPNLNLLGEREPDRYGHTGSKELVDRLSKEFPLHEIHYFQSNHEGEICDRIQEARHLFDGILINAGGYSHTSVSIADALRAIPVPAVSVHITDPGLRESFRQTDVVGAACKGCIAGLGIAGYSLAMECLLDLI